MFKYFILLILLPSFIGCDINIGGGSEPELEPATEILGFSFSPSDTVAVGDSLTITCLVKDSLDNDLRFIWSVGIHASQASGNNNITFQVKDGSGIVNGSIRISSSEPSTEAVEKSFQFVIK